MIKKSLMEEGAGGDIEIEQWISIKNSRPDMRKI